MNFVSILLFLCTALLVAGRYPIIRGQEIARVRNMTLMIVWLSLGFLALRSLSPIDRMTVGTGAAGTAALITYAMSRSVEGRRLLQTSAPREYSLILTSILWFFPQDTVPFITFTTLAVWLVSAFTYFAGRYYRWESRRKTVSVRVEYTNLSDHVVIYGYGDLAVIIIKALHAAQIPYVIVDSDHRNVTQAKLQGYAVVEASEGTPKEFVTYSMLNKAKCLVMLNPGGEIAEHILLAGKKANPSLFILAAVSDEAASKRLAALGADVVLRRDFELALTIVKHIAVIHQMKRDRVNTLLKKLRFIQGVTG